MRLVAYLPNVAVRHIGRLARHMGREKLRLTRGCDDTSSAELSCELVCELYIIYGIIYSRA
jgi:hypothetical protein